VFTYAPAIPNLITTLITESKDQNHSHIPLTVMSSTSSAASTEQMKEMYKKAAKGSMGSEETIKAAEELYINMTVASIYGRTFTKASVTNVRLMSERTGQEHNDDITISDKGEDIQATFE
jgi:uncharacterized protein with beta-barrel porin domain